jgi:two-component system, OmpR family, sensor histidine kinase KdpD
LQTPKIGLRCLHSWQLPSSRGQLSERARRETLRATQRRREIEQLYAFTQPLLTLESVPGLLNLVPRHITETFGCRGAAKFVSERTDVYRSDADTGEIDTSCLLSAATQGEPIIDADHALAFIPLRLGV